VSGNPYVEKRHIEVFLREAKRRIPDAVRGMNQRTVDDLWGVMVDDLRRYVAGRGMPHAKSVSAESATPLEQSFIPPHIQAEGVAFVRNSLVGLARYEESDWRDLFRYEERNVLKLFMLWLHYLRDPRST
jgi:hypothetical protein